MKEVGFRGTRGTRFFQKKKKKKKKKCFYLTLYVQYTYNKY